MPDFLDTENNYLGITEKKFFNYSDSNVVIQSVPYEHTSSYLSGSFNGPQAVINASHFVEFYDEELDSETYKKTGICTLKPLDFSGKSDKAAIDFIENETSKLLDDNKFIVSLGAEHTVTLGFFSAFYKKNKNIGILQIDAHSDLRQSYNNNIYSHASVMARIHELGAKIYQVGIRAQCLEEAELIKSSDTIYTWYAYQINSNANWQNEVIEKLPENIYLTIDADGFDPSVIPAVGTAEPGGLGWYETLKFLKEVCVKKNVVGFDIVECAPRQNEIISQFNLAKLLYKILGYCSLNNNFALKYHKK
ncbi:MAG: agmatinase [Bacteroidetes bacterium]|nr:agmatinase [Bacteroidota bacterium]